ncbi:MAG: methyltransferase family protein [Pauljensenia sp.]
MERSPVYNHVPDLCVLGLSGVAIALPWLFPWTILFPPSLRLVGGILIVGAGLVGAVTLGALRAAATSTNPVDAPTQMLTTGPFRLSRNPLYLAYVLAVLGSALLGGSWAALTCPLACFSILNWLIVPIEERAMLRVFGEEYERYRREVRRWL